MAFSRVTGKPFSRVTRKPFSRATGKHRRPSRLTRTSAQVAGVAALTTTGVVGGLAAPALAAEPALEDTGLNRALSISDALPEQIDAQAAAQRHAADEAVARKKAEQDARKRAAEAKRKAEERAARAAER